MHWFIHNRINGKHWFTRQVYLLSKFLTKLWNTRLVVLIGPIRTSYWSGTLIYGCNQYRNKVGGDRSEEFDEEHAEISSLPNGSKFAGPNDQRYPRQVAGFWGYTFQIIFQMQAGTVVLTDCVFWFIIVPFLAIKDYNLNFFIINMHSINAVFLLGDTALNSMRFPWFRIAYFVLWTCVFVAFQWIVHACIYIWWPYPFLDLSSPFSPLWYLSVALLQVPCYGIFVLVIKLKHFLLSKLLL